MKNRKVHLSFMNYLSGGSLTSVVKHTSGPGPKPGDSRRRSQSQVNVMHESTKGEGKEVSRNRQRIWSDVLVRDYDDDCEPLIVIRKVRKETVEGEDPAGSKSSEKPKDKQVATAEAAPEVDKKPSSSKDERSQDAAPVPQSMEDTKQSDDEKKAHNSEDQPAITSSRNNTNKTPETSEPPDSKTSNGAKAANSNGSWTKQQDEKIKSMKGVNSSWKNIAAAVGATKKDVTQRYQELMDAAKDPSATDSAHGAATNSNSDTHVAESLPMMSGALDGDAWLASRDSLCQTLGDPGTSNTAAARDKSSKSRPDGSKVSQACQAQESTATAAATNAIPTSTNAFPTGAELAELLKGYPGLLCHQPLYPLSALNNDGSLGADKSPWTIRTGGDWTECECAMLEKLLRRYENNKWLHIQAGLFNMTGRMVDGEVIRQKVEVDRVKGSG